MPVVTGTKRKSGGVASSHASKQQKRTIETFFSPQVLAQARGGNDGEDRRAVPLNREQTAILRQILDGENLFFTGSAGTGKSLLLRAVIRALKKKFQTADAVAVTASTGMAATNIGGMTIHAWGGVAPNPLPLSEQIRHIRHCKPALQRWKKAQVLIIDEVSMVDGALFTRICEIAQRLRETNSPFGGIQLVVTGDFFQLPPVTRGGQPVFAFECDAWTRCIQHTLTLSHVFRQKDEEFITLLNELRLGQISPAARATFQALSRPLPPDPSGIIPTELFSLRREVERANLARLDSLRGHEHSFVCRDSGKAPSETRAKLLENVMAPAKLVLKVGAQVMLIKNLDERLVNGSVGKVIGFWTRGEVQSEQERLKKSHIRNIDKTTLVPPNGSASENRDNRGLGASSSCDTSRDGERYPLVEFQVLDDSTMEAVLLVSDEFRVEDAQGEVVARRMQIPLILAWAISIHKSQGQTLHRVKIDLGKVFEKGQSYVALSRAASMAGLQVLGFDANKVRAHPKVLSWNLSLKSHAPTPSSPS